MAKDKHSYKTVKPGISNEEKANDTAPAAQQGPLSAYLPGIILFVVMLIIGLATYKDYGMGWDEPAQRGPGELSYNYIMTGNKDLFIKPSDNHGAGFELLLIFIEKGAKMTDPKAIYEMRHIVTHVFFLISVFCGYVLVLKLIKNKYLASLAFIMLAFAPRIYGHSFVNSKDLPFLSTLIIAFMLAQMAFEQRKIWLYLALGAAVGYATSIRIMGSMVAVFIVGFMVIDLISDMKQGQKQNAGKLAISLGVFTVLTLSLLYISWPYLWKSPVHTFVESFGKMSHFAWTGALLFKGELLSSDKPLPWIYFPTWFMISNPPLWLLAGFAGIATVLYDFFKKPLLFFRNTRERNFLLYFGSFIVPIFAVIILKSVIYDDWRHLYFVYPAFVFMGIYAIDKLLTHFKQARVMQIVYGACILQTAAILVFMVQSHPFSMVYFNSLVSHEDESLRHQYDLEYWGCSFKQALDFIIENNNAPKIKICCIHKTPLDNNIMMLPKEQRDRIEFIANAQDADYFITNFRLHPDDFPSTNIAHQIQVQNSTIMRIYKMH